MNRAWIDLQSRINKQGLKPGRNRLLWRGVVAASIIILLGVIPLIVPQDVKNVSSEAEIQIRPGHRNAILELADGKVYNLTNLEYGGITGFLRILLWIVVVWIISGRIR